jgi:hypothetical protein
MALAFYLAVISQIPAYRPDIVYKTLYVNNATTQRDAS